MSSTAMSERTVTSDAEAGKSGSVPKVDLKLEVVILPVADVERAKRFYTGLGWRLDADVGVGEEWRVVQMTPRGSPCSIIFGRGVTSAEPGSVQGTFLVVDDIEAARRELVERGAAPSDVFRFAGGLHVTGTDGRIAGRDPAGNSYSSWVSFSDPDGNGWLLQEVKQRLPGRGYGVDVATLAELLREAEEHHGGYERTAARHHWSDWYAAFIIARGRGRTRDDAADDAARHLKNAG